jgi:endoglucanase
VRLRLVVVLLCLLALAAVAVGVRISRTPDNSTTTAGHSFFDRYVERDGRVVRRDQGGDTVSEGQAYALLLTVARGEQQRFTTVWEWTREHLRRDDGLFSWRWANGRVVDTEAAADADVDIAHALALAIDRFGLDDLQRELQRISNGILDSETVAAKNDLVLVAGPWARSKRIVNPSYFSPCAYDLLAGSTDDDRWHQLSSGSVDVLGQLITTDRLPPDWAVVDGGGVARPIPAPGRNDGAPQYGLDAARVALRLASCDTSAQPLLRRLWPTLERLPSHGAAIAYDLNGRTAQTSTHPLGLLAASVTARVTGHAAASRSLLDEARALDRRTPTYYGAAWLALHDAAFGNGTTRPTMALISHNERVVGAPPTTAGPSAAPSTVGSAPTTPPTTVATAPSTGPPTTSSTSAPTTPPRSPGAPAPPPSAPSTGPTSPAPSAPGAPSAGGSAPGTPEQGSTTTGPSGGPPPGTAPRGPGQAPLTSAPRPGGISESVDAGQLLERGDRPDRRAADTRQRKNAAVFTGGLFAAAAAGIALGIRQRVLRRRTGAVE